MEFVWLSHPSRIRYRSNLRETEFRQRSSQCSPSVNCRKLSISNSIHLLAHGYSIALHRLCVMPCRAPMAFDKMPFRCRVDWTMCVRFELSILYFSHSQPNRSYSRRMTFQIACICDNKEKSNARRSTYVARPLAFIAKYFVLSFFFCIADLNLDLPIRSRCRHCFLLRLTSRMPSAAALHDHNPKLEMNLNWFSCKFRDHVRQLACVREIFVKLKNVLEKKFERARVHTIRQRHGNIKNGNFVWTPSAGSETSCFSNSHINFVLDNSIVN